jgi:lipopolysaccharide biosynthesis protein
MTAVSQYLAQIADILLQFGPAFRLPATLQNGQPNGERLNKMENLIGQTRTVAQNFNNVVEGTLARQEIDDLVQRLQKALNDKEILTNATRLGELQQHEVDRQLDEIAQSAGMLQGFSITLKAMANQRSFSR